MLILNKTIALCAIFQTKQKKPRVANGKVTTDYFGELEEIKWSCCTRCLKCRLMFIFLILKVRWQHFDNVDKLNVFIHCY